MEPEKIQEVVIDTNRLVHSCSTIGEKNRDFRNESELDKEVRNLGISPREIRDEIKGYIENNNLLVPEIIEQELKDFLLPNCKKVNDSNRKLIKSLLERIKGKIVQIAIGIKEYKLQKEIFELVKAQAQEKVREIERKTNSNLNNWEHRKKEIKINPMLKKVYEEDVCKTWAKIAEFEEDVHDTANGIKSKKPFILNDLQIIITAKKRNALISTRDADIRTLSKAYNTIIKRHKLEQSIAQDQNQGIGQMA